DCLEPGLSCKLLPGGREVTSIPTMGDADLIEVRPGHDPVPYGNELLLAEPNLGAVLEWMRVILAQRCEGDVDLRVDSGLAHPAKHGTKAVAIFVGRHRRVIGVGLALMPAQQVDCDAGPLEPMEREHQAGITLPARRP